MGYRVLFFCFLLLAGFFSCDQIQIEKSSLPPGTGKYGEVLVVVDTTYENRKTGDLLKQIFFKSSVGLPQQEAQFRMATVSPKNFKSILKRSRNILKLSIGKGKKTAINIEENVWAKNQLMLQITAASDEDASRILEKNTQTIRNYFNEKEIQRLQKQYAKKPLKKLASELRSEYGIDMIIPPGFVKMQSNEKGFWLKKEKSIGEHQVIQGISFYSYPYESDSTFSIVELINNRNTFTKEFIEGGRDSSYMAVYEEYKPVSKEVNFNNKYSKEYRGLWNMKNDFMGGPFLHYIFVDEERNRVINLDGFVYAPKFNKREYLRELEALLKTTNLVKVN